MLSIEGVFSTGHGTALLLEITLKLDCKGGWTELGSMINPAFLAAVSVALSCSVLGMFFIMLLLASAFST